MSIKCTLIFLGTSLVILLILKIFHDYNIDFLNKEKKGVHLCLRIFNKNSRDMK